MFCLLCFVCLFFPIFTFTFLDLGHFWQVLSGQGPAVPSCLPITKVTALSRPSPGEWLPQFLHAQPRVQEGVQEPWSRDLGKLKVAR